VHAARREGDGRGRRRRNPRRMRSASGRAAVARRGDRVAQLQPVSPGVALPAGPGRDPEHGRGDDAVKLEGTRSFAAPRDTVWEVLNSPEQMAKLMPGVESFDVKDDMHWRANVKIPLGLGILPMSIDFTKLEE